MNKTITQARLKRAVNYDANTGIFTWRISNSNRAVVGNEAGCENKVLHYRQICIDGVSYKTHRLAWLYVYGRWPKKYLDHANGDTLDNRIVNLREATGTQNQANRRLNKNNKAGFKGIHFFPRTGKWRAQITIKSKGKHIGYYDTPRQAHAAYVAAARAAFGEFARAG